MHFDDLMLDQRHCGVSAPDAEKADLEKAPEKLPVNHRAAIPVALPGASGLFQSGQLQFPEPFAIDCIDHPDCATDEDDDEDIHVKEKDRQKRPDKNDVRKPFFRGKHALAHCNDHIDDNGGDARCIPFIAIAT